MDPEERRFRLADMMLRHLHHQVGLRHSDLQRRFVLALSVAAAVGLSVLRAELPWWASGLVALPLLWAARELRTIRNLVSQEDAQAKFILRLAETPPGAKDSTAGEGNHR